MPENYKFTEKFFLKEITLQRMICTRHSRTVRRDDNNNTTTTHLFSLLSVDKFKCSLYKIHGKRYIVYLGGLLSSQELEVQFIDVISVLNGNMKHARAIEFD